MKIQFKYRNNFTRKELNKLRFLKQVPAVIYENNYKNNIHISIPEKTLIHIKFDKYNKNILLICNKIFFEVKIQEIQLHPYKNKIMHIDFLITKSNIYLVNYYIVVLLLSTNKLFK